MQTFAKDNGLKLVPLVVEQISLDPKVVTNQNSITAGAQAEVQRLTQENQNLKDELAKLKAAQ